MSNIAVMLPDDLPPSPPPCTELRHWVRSGQPDTRRDARAGELRTARVTTPWALLANRATFSSTVLTFPPITGKSQEGTKVRRGGR
jgi:hypothetical protein